MSSRVDASLANLEVFCRTFELGNFTRAARNSVVPR
jgi:hypothetical protein